jgi:uncharacterized protein (UPF0261 family)
MEKIIALLGTLDTKGPECAYLKSCIERLGHKALVIDAGVQNGPAMPSDIQSKDVAAAGGTRQSKLIVQHDVRQTVDAMSRGAAKMLSWMHSLRRFDGVIAFGGEKGTLIACNAMRVLPLGVPKLMVSSAVSGDVSHFIGLKDIVLFPYVVDIPGIHRVSREVLMRAAGAICGMTAVELPQSDQKALVVISANDKTLPAVERAREILESSGCETLLFPCTGLGGKIMESLIETGMVAGVLDLTTGELADELLGGIHSAGPTRLEAAVRKGVPLVVAPGCMDLVNFGGFDTIPVKFEGREFQVENPTTTVVRTNREECERLGKLLAEKLNLGSGPAAVFLPTKGFSPHSIPGGRFANPEADAALCAAVKNNVRKDVAVVPMDCDINAPAFAEKCVAHLLQDMRVRRLTTRVVRL